MTRKDIILVGCIAAMIWIAIWSTLLVWIMGAPSGWDSGERGMAALQGFLCGVLFVWPTVAIAKWAAADPKNKNG